MNQLEIELALAAAALIVFLSLIRSDIDIEAVSLIIGILKLVRPPPGPRRSHPRSHCV